jgi:hypothetical protein
MKKATRLGCFSAVGLLLAAFAAAVCCVLMGPTFRRWDEDAVRQKVAVALPLGSTRTQAEAWLASEGLSLGDIYDGQGNVCGLSATKPYSNWGGERGEIDIELYFDTGGKLTQRHVDIDVPSL